MKNNGIKKGDVFLCIKSLRDSLEDYDKGKTYRSDKDNHIIDEHDCSHKIDNWRCYFNYIEHIKEENMIEIKKGDKFLCIRNFLMDDGEIAYKEGNTYVSDRNDCITDEIHDAFHEMNDIDINIYFKKIDDASGVFVYYKGDAKRGNEIIEALKSLGGETNTVVGNSPERYYFVNSLGYIDFVNVTNSKWLREHYTEMFLPKLKINIDPFDKIIYKEVSFPWLPVLFCDITNQEGKLKTFIQEIVPYNDETKYLCYTDLSCPDKYKNYKDNLNI